jgi:putative endonuclease
MSVQKPWFLYLIECADGSIYTGIAVDVAARYAAHCNGTGARYTRSHAPVKLLGFEAHPDRSSASKAEYRIKKLSAGEKRQFAAGLLPLIES